MLLGIPPESCGMSGVCSLQNVVEADGGVYPCDFYVTDRYRLGSVNENSFEEIYQKRQALRFIEESRVPDPGCADCRWRALCGNGCKRYREPRLPDGTFQRNFFCESYRQFFDYAYPRLCRVAEFVARGGRFPAG